MHASADKRVRVALVIDSLAAGGAERHVTRLAMGLSRAGAWDVSVFCLNRSGPFVTELETGGIRVAGAGARWSRLLAAWWLWTLIRHFRAQRPEIAHCYLNTAGILGAIAARLSGVPFVITTRRVVHEFHGPKLALYRVVARLMDALSDNVVAVSDTARRQAIAEGTPADKAVTIRNGVSPSEAFQARGARADHVTLLTVARLHPNKGHRYLISALPAILTALPTVQLHIVGDGPERADLDNLVRALGVSDRVLFLGERSDVPERLAAADIFVLPSLVEGMPNSVLEAMAAGVPVVATRVGGVPELVTDEATGLLVEPASPHELAQAVVRMALDVGLRTSCAVAAHGRAAREFGPQRELEATEAVYNALLAARGSKLHRMPASAGSSTTPSTGGTGS